MPVVISVVNLNGLTENLIQCNIVALSHPGKLKTIFDSLDIIGHGFDGKGVKIA